MNGARNHPERYIPAHCDEKSMLATHGASSSLRFGRSQCGRTERMRQAMATRTIDYVQRNVVEHINILVFGWLPRVQGPERHT